MTGFDVGVSWLVELLADYVVSHFVDGVWLSCVEFVRAISLLVYFVTPNSVERS